MLWFTFSIANLMVQIWHLAFLLYFIFGRKNLEKKLTFIHCFFFFKFTCTSSITFLLERQPQDTCWSAELSLFDLSNVDQFCNSSFFFLCSCLFYLFFQSKLFFFIYFVAFIKKIFLAFAKVRNRLEPNYWSNIRSRWYFKIY